MSAPAEARPDDPAPDQGYAPEPPMGKAAPGTGIGPVKAKPSSSGQTKKSSSGGTKKSSSGQTKKKSTWHPDRKADCCCHLAMLPCMCCMLAGGAG